MAHYLSNPKIAVERVPYLFARSCPRGATSLMLHSGSKQTTINVVWQECRLGGRCALLVCPVCDKNRRYLSVRGERVACRECLGLTYRTRQETPFGRACIRYHQIVKKFGLPPGASLPFTKPKWMRWPTFYRLLEDGRRAEAQMCGYVARRYGRG